jgi:hypothetical protein
MVLTGHDIVKYKYRARTERPMPSNGDDTMLPTPWLVETLQREREREMEADRLARFAARIRACCNPSMLTASRAFCAASPSPAERGSPR